MLILKNTLFCHSHQNRLSSREQIPLNYVGAQEIIKAQTFEQIPNINK